MINKLKKEIKRFVDVRVKVLKNQQNHNQQVHLNYLQISQLFKGETFIPLTGWSISPTTILHVLNDITINKRKSVVEFGSGASTFYIAKLIKVLNLDCTFYSVESNQEWAREIKENLKAYNLEDYGKIIFAPLEEVPVNLSLRNQKTWYSTQVLTKELKVNNIDLIIVDGPFGGSSPYARYSAIPFLKEKLSPACSIFLDDIDRAHEREILNQWKSILVFETILIERYALLYTKQDFDVQPFKLESFAF